MTRSGAGSGRPGLSGQVMVIDAFAAVAGEGNPAAVVVLENWPADEILQRFAHEQGLSETAFLIPAVDDAVDFRLRWFTPTVEMDLCGHATLASAHAVRELALARGEASPERVVFTSRSGLLVVTHDRATQRLSLDFPARMPAQIDSPELLERVAAALGHRPAELQKSRDLLAVFESDNAVAGLDPDFDAVAALGVHGIIATAQAQAGERDAADVVSRFFAPEVGVPEDPVTGSAHCTVVPFWADRLGRSDLVCRQISQRGGTLWCRYRREDERVDLAGHAVTVSPGTAQL